MLSPNFYETLTPVEQAYWHRFAELFQLVAAQKPEKGIETLIRRARNAATEKGHGLSEELESTFQAAQARTLRRIELLNRCQR